ncbi:MAG: serine/threonine-protein phosphatase, partial [Streptosporangiaceae bacterium]
MVSSSPRFRPSSLTGRARDVVAWVQAMVRKQFITENRRLAFALALVTVAIVVAAVHISVWWFSPGVVILPILAGGLLLFPRALRILFG